MALALITSGTLAAGITTTKTKVLSGSIEKQYGIREISGSGDAVTGSIFANSRPTHIVQINGVYTPDSGSTFPLPVVGSAITGNPLFKLSRVVVTKSQRVKNTTGASDAYGASVFTAGRPVYRGSGFGWAKTDDAILANLTATGGDIASLDCSIYSTGPVKIESAIKITSYRMGLPFRDGGPVPVQFQFLFNDITPTLTNTPLAATSFTATVDTNTDIMEATLVPYMIRCDIDYENAVPTVVDISGPFSGTVTVS